MKQPVHSIFTSDLLWTIGILVLVFALLRALVLPRIADAISQRAKAIEEDVLRAKQTREAGSPQEKEPEHFRGQIDEADQDVQRMIAESTERVRKQHDELMETCKEDIASRGAAFHEEAESLREKAMQEIRAEAAKGLQNDNDSDPEAPTLKH